MPMTRLQRRNLQLYLRFRDKQMTVAQLIWCNRRIYLLLLLVFAIVAALFYAAAGTLGASFAGVALAVMVLRDIGYYRRSVAIWPALQRVLDWTKVEQLLVDDITPKA